MKKYKRKKIFYFKYRKLIFQVFKAHAQEKKDMVIRSGRYNYQKKGYGQ